MKSGSRLGFTLIEALIALVLVAVGVVGVTGAISALTSAQSKMQTIERLQRLAASKYQELVATGDYATINEGDFADQDLPDYHWTCEVETTSYDGVAAVRVTAIAPGRQGDRRSVSSIVFEPPEESSTAGAVQ